MQQAKEDPHHGETEGLCLYPLEGILNVISRKWTLLIINTLGNYGTLRFNTLMKKLGGISPTVLSDTLEALQDEKMVKRKSFAEIPPRVEYSLTADGKELREAIIPLVKWAAKRDTHTHSCPPDQQKTPVYHIQETDS